MRRLKWFSFLLIFLFLLSCKGTDGENGSNGTSGVGGSDGQDGQDGRGGQNAISKSVITSRTSCFWDVPDYNMKWAYNVYVFNTGDVFVEAGFSNPQRESSKSIMYAKGDPDNSLAPLKYIYDIEGDENRGIWVVSLDRTENITVLEYIDIDLADALVFTQTNDKCSTISYTTN